VSEERLSTSTNGDILYTLKKAWSDGTTAVVFSPLEFMEKLAALVPPPRVHLTRFHGIFAPHSKYRPLAVPEKVAIKPEENTSTGSDKPSLSLQESLSPSSKRIPWAKLLARVFAIDMESCERCHGRMRAIAAVLKETAVVKILTHLGLPAKPPPIAPSTVALQLDLGPLALATGTAPSMLRPLKTSSTSTERQQKAPWVSTLGLVLPKNCSPSRNQMPAAKKVQDSPGLSDLLTFCGATSPFLIEGILVPCSKNLL